MKTREKRKRISRKTKRRKVNMMSTLPVDLKRVSKEKIDEEILRAGMIAELDAVSFYEQMAALSENAKIKEALLDIAKEEKTHMGEFQALLLTLDKEQVKELENGRKEIEKM
jgi:rubrerythrin